MIGFGEKAYENGKRDFARGGDIRSHHGGKSADSVSRVQPASEEKNGPVFVRDVQAGRRGLALLALRPFRGGVL